MLRHIRQPHLICINACTEAIFVPLKTFAFTFQNQQRRPPTHATNTKDNPSVVPNYLCSLE